MFIIEPILAILAALLISHFLMAHTTIPTGSMIPTININDHMIINRIPYYYRNPERGELVIFRYEGQNLIKRVVGMAGDIIDMEGGRVYINGEEFDELEYINTPNTTYPQFIKYPYTVPENSYFVMGDNRENSGDSRSFGAVTRADIIATGGYRIYPFNNLGWVR